ncbi:acyclic terpene utilization AtuA family protein [Marinifilum fragile]|uniref:acyclic terpene utilization AtuA family protein n=1 Tax=Marinifilum fragile TaxID=570161 RepID=UPI002AA934E7|nr:acyclic terpene utilization AtuA family protein [Marinifilum fragile]
MKTKIRIANAGGFWGDDLGVLRRQLEGGEVDYISSDFLAEVTMSILRKQQLKNEALGYVTDFVDQIVDVADLMKSKGVRMITNAGGINPIGCARKILSELEKKGVSLKIAVVDGDNIVDRIDEFYPAKANFKNMDSGDDFESIIQNIQSANVYLGVPPLLKALESGADLILAGRVTDTSVTMAPMIYELGWELNDWDKLAAGLVAGHIIECGAQSTGGNFTDWEKVERWDNMGYPIVEMKQNGDFTVYKHENTGGLISVDTIREQLVYEMGNPDQYISPDVVADFTHLKLEELESNKVLVSGAKGYPSTPYLKVSMAYEDGYKATSSIVISGGRVLNKAQEFEKIFWDRLDTDFLKKNTEFVGYNACHQHLADHIDPNEILLRLSVYDTDVAKIRDFSMSIAPLILSGPPGVAVTGGRARMQQVITYWPTLIPKECITSTVHVLNEQGEVIESNDIGSVLGYEEELTFKEASEHTDYINPAWEEDRLITVALRDICLGRSGDKGDTVNIGVLARSEEIYQYLKHDLTAEKLSEMFFGMVKGKIHRYEIDNLLALNFLLEESLDGGGTKSLMIDAQGKTFATALLNQEIMIPEKLLSSMMKVESQK